MQLQSKHRTSFLIHKFIMTSLSGMTIRACVRNILIDKIVTIFKFNKIKQFLVESEF